MSKFLFNDGSNEIKEVSSLEELHELIKRAEHKENVKVWKYNTNRWMNYVELIELLKREKSIKEGEVVEGKVVVRDLKDQKKKRKWLFPALTIFFLVLAAVAYFVFRSRWQEATNIEIFADRPENSPKLDVDSLIQEIEINEARKLDRLTKTNLRIRNNWPDKIVLKVSSARDKKAGENSTAYKYRDSEIFIENYTGYNIDEAIIKLNIWKTDRLIKSDTFQVKNIGYTEPVTRKSDNIYRGDSLSVSFQFIKSKDLHFCYSSEKQSNYGNLNDRWFCRE